MTEKILFTDLDNTMIYSYKHEIGPDKRCVELYQGREVSYITEQTYVLLCVLRKEMMIVPVTTRSIEQYQRIDLGTGMLPYALVCNGGILLVGGERDEVWYRESLELIKESRPQLEKAKVLLEEDDRRYFELRMIEDLFLFTKCKEPEKVIAGLGEKLDQKLVDVFHNGDKVYVVPTKLNKGEAIMRFKRRYEREGHPSVRTMAAGDSGFDVSMLQKADTAIVPSGFERDFPEFALYGESAAAGKDTRAQGKAVVMEAPADRIFSEYVLECARSANRI